MIGPWTAIQTRPQAGGLDWFVARDVSPRPSFTHWEQLRNSDGEIRKFATKQEAEGERDKQQPQPVREPAPF